MEKKALIDTNILIYSIDASSVYNKQARAVLRLVENGELIAYIADKSLYELVAALSSKAFQEKIDKNSIQEQVLYFINNPLYNILYSTEHTLTSSLRFFYHLPSKKNYIFDIEIATLAIEHNINTIYTKNIKDFSTFEGLNIIDPTATKPG